MEHEIRITDDHFEIVYTGDATLEGFDTVLRDLTSHGSWKEGSAVLNDYRAVDFTRLKSYAKMEAVMKSSTAIVKNSEGYGLPTSSPSAKCRHTRRSRRPYGATTATSSVLSTDDREKALFWLKRRS